MHSIDKKSKSDRPPRSSTTTAGVGPDSEKARSASSHTNTEATATTQVNEAISKSGQSLSAETRPYFERRFGHDFSQVRVHQDAQAAQSAAALDARAYTLGNHIVFGAGEYAPQTRIGKSLLAHELAHVIQQEKVHSTIQTKLMFGSSSDGSEQAADTAAHTVMNPEISSPSAALRIRKQLRSTSSSQPIIRRAVKTWGGEFDTDKYALTKDAGMDGVDIALRFKPGSNINAELIGMTQTARSLEKSSPVYVGSGAAKKALKQRTIPVGETGAGTRVDRLSEYGNPLYATGRPGAKDKLEDTPTHSGWGQHGWHYKNGAGKLQKQDALLKDRPQLLSTRKQTSQIFETTALAVKGSQSGTYYGSVQWGWEKDAAGTVTKLPLSVVSQGVPSATFGRASELWNQAKTSLGKATLDLPVVDVQVISSAGADLYATPDTQSIVVPATPLPVGTRFRVLTEAEYVRPTPVLHIEIVDGPLTYQRGYILDSVAFNSER